MYRADAGLRTACLALCKGSGRAALRYTLRPMSALRINRMWRVSLLVAVVASACIARAVSAETLTVAVASNFTATLKDVGDGVRSSRASIGCGSAARPPASCMPRSSTARRSMSSWPRISRIRACSKPMVSHSPIRVSPTRPVALRSGRDRRISIVLPGSTSPATASSRSRIRCTRRTASRRAMRSSLWIVWSRFTGAPGRR